MKNAPETKQQELEAECLKIEWKVASKRWSKLYPVYTIEQTSSCLVHLKYSQLVEPAWSYKRSIS